jgi:lipopolysaccharide transport system permease protein
VVIELFLRLALLGLLLAWFAVKPAWTALLLPISLVPLALMTIGLGLILAPLNAVVRDTANAVTAITTFGMFLAPVVYPPPTEWPQAAVNYLNPVSPFVIAARELIVGADLSHPRAFVAASGFGVLAFAIGWRSFRLIMARALERI